MIEVVQGTVGAIEGGGGGSEAGGAREGLGRPVADVRENREQAAAGVWAQTRQHRA